MDVNRINATNRLIVEFKDMKGSSQIRRTFVEVILIDRTNLVSTQMCYMLKNDEVFNDTDIENFKQGYYNFDKEDFILIGEVISIDKRQKFVTLKDQNSISYNHMIIATGSQHSMTYQFIAGVNTLVDAIRVRKKIPSSFPETTTKTTTTERKMKSSKTQASDLNFPKKIETVKTRKMSKLKEKDSSSLLNNPNKRLYEVQI